MALPMTEEGEMLYGLGTGGGTKKREGRGSVGAWPCSSETAAAAAVVVVVVVAVVEVA